jgi:hypothetical protein
MTHGGYGGNPFDGPVGGAPVAGRPAAAPAGALPPTHGQQRETNTLATLAVVFAFVFAPAGAILGHLGLGQIARTGQRGRERALTGITLSYFFITVAVVGLVVWAAIGQQGSPALVATPPSTTTAPSTSTAVKPSPAPPPPAPTVNATALQGILIPLPDLRTLIDDQAQTPLGTSDTVEMPPGDGGKFDDYSCYTSFIGGIPAAYDGTDWRTFYSSDSSNRATGLQIGQAAALFDDAAAAQRALQRYLEMWRGCAGKTAQWFPPGRPTVTVTFGAPKDMGNGITMLNNTVFGMAKPVAWTRLLAVKQNVLIDNAITGVDMGDDPTKVTEAMLDRIQN